MIAGRHSEDYYPITWMGRVPIYATTLLVVIHVAAMVGTAIATSVSGVMLPIQSPILRPFFFSNADIVQGFKIWQFVTYAFVNSPSLGFVVEMWLLYSFGREVEKFLGRRGFLWLYLALLVAAPVVLTALKFAGVPAVIGGSGAISLAVFIAFVVIYPNAQIFFSIQAKWIAAILLGIYSLEDIANSALLGWIPLGVLWLECACAVLMLRLSGVTNASLDAWLPAREEEPVRPVRSVSRREELPEPDLHDSIDPLLEKISRHGIASLTKQERQRLEQARHALIEREKHSH